MQSRNTIKKRSLACTVWTDKTHQLSLFQGKRNIVIGPQAIEIFRNIMDFQQCHYPRFLRRTFSTIPHMPLGSTAEMSMIMPAYIIRSMPTNPALAPKYSLR